MPLEEALAMRGAHAIDEPRRTSAVSITRYLASIRAR
jgi:hypothetical protein